MNDFLLTARWQGPLKAFDVSTFHRVDIGLTLYLLERIFFSYLRFLFLWKGQLQLSHLWCATALRDNHLDTKSLSGNGGESVMNGHLFLIILPSSAALFFWISLPRFCKILLILQRMIMFFLGVFFPWFSVISRGKETFIWNIFTRYNQWG